jgi:hypothetical protein
MLIGPEFAPVFAIWLVVLEPVVEEPVVLEPLVLEPVVLDPVVEEPVVPEPVVEAAVVEDVSPALVVDEVSWSQSNRPHRKPSPKSRWRHQSASRTALRPEQREERSRLRLPWPHRR